MAPWDAQPEVSSTTERTCGCVFKRCLQAALAIPLQQSLQATHMRDEVHNTCDGWVGWLGKRLMQVKR
eukprot:4786677-Amphidinium_carterae.1